MKTPSRSSESVSKRYKHFVTNLTQWALNTSTKFCVVVGSDVINSDGGYVFQVLDKNSNVIDAVRVVKDTAAGFTLVHLPRHMLVPPGGAFNPGGVTPLYQVVECATEEDAYAIL